MKKQLGFWSVLSLVVGNMVGVGIFIMPSLLAPYGSLSLLGWFLTLGGALLIALVFSKLSSILPSAGGPYAYARAGFGDFIGFQAAWTYWISLWVGSTATIVSTLGYMSIFWPQIATDPVVSFSAGLSVIWGLTLINLISISFAGRFQLIITILKILPLGLLFLFAIPHINMDHFKVINPSGKPPLMALIEVGALTMWGFIGLECATIPADHVEEPKKTIPRATVLGTLIVGFIYISISALVIGLVPNDILQKTPASFALAAKTIFGQGGAFFIACAAVLAAVGSLNGWFLIQSQIPLAAARDSLFPKKFQKTTANGTPIFGLLATAILMSALLFMNYSKNLIQTFNFMVTLATLSILITYLFSVLSELMLFLEQPQKFRKRDLVKALALTIPATAYILIALIGAGQEIMMWGSFLFFASAPVYILVRWQNRPYSLTP
jgi:APA family basic amino acid/polyamine antiporter